MLARYKNLHVWMLIPMAIMQVGICRDYWGDFSENAWSVHIHYWTVTLWYSYLIIQPYFATHGQLDKHRTNGIVGMFLAGGVAIAALSMLHRDMESAEMAAKSPERFGPFEPWFFYGVATVEVVMVTAFIFAVTQAIRHRNSVEDHAWWLISTVFLVMMPALGRGVTAAWFVLFGVDWAGRMNAHFITEAIIISLTLWAAVKYARLNHPATWLVVGVNLFNLFVEPIGKWTWWQDVLRAVIRG